MCADQRPQGGPLITIYEPGLVKCASPTTPEERVKDGTSYAAPMVAGLAAYYFSLPDLGDMMRINPTSAIPGVMKGFPFSESIQGVASTDMTPIRWRKYGRIMCHDANSIREAVSNLEEVRTVVQFTE